MNALWSLQDSKNLHLFRKAKPRRVAINFANIFDASENKSSLSGKILQVRDLSNPRWNVIINFDLEGRLLRIMLGRQTLGNEVFLLERSFDGEFYIYQENCINLQDHHGEIYYYYDYYNEMVNQDLEVARNLIDIVSLFLNELYKHRYTSNQEIEFVVVQVKGEKINTISRYNRLPNELTQILEKARAISTWEGLLAEKAKFRRVYSSLDVLPPEVRPDLNPVFAIVQLSQGCWIRNNRGACHFCASYRGVPFRERDSNEIIEHINGVRDLMGKNWINVRKIFLSDADPLHSSNAEFYLRLLLREIPQVRYFSSFITTLTILSKSVQEWTRLKNLGLQRVYWGVESADNLILNLLGKPQNSTTLYRAAHRLNAAGIEFVPIVMSGVDLLSKNESHSSHALKTAEFIGKVRPIAVYVSKFTPVPGTFLWNMIKGRKIKNPAPQEIEIQHRLLINTIKNYAPDVEVRGGYGLQFAISAGGVA